MSDYEDEIRALIKRCYIHVLKAEDAGMHTTADVLWSAACQLEGLTGFYVSEKERHCTNG